MRKEDNIIEMNDKKYLLVELSERTNQGKTKLIKFGCIYKGRKLVNASYWAGNTYLDIFLVPINKIEEYNKYFTD